MNKRQIAPSVLSANFAQMESEVVSVERAGASLIHLDVMDGSFVPNISFGAKMVQDIRKITSLTLDVHLMIVSPFKHIESFLKAGADILTFHIEAVGEQEAIECIELIRSSGKKCGVAISPDTHLARLEPIIDKCDMITLMSVYPGFGGQSFLEGAFERLKALQSMVEQRGLNTLIEVDGGINQQNAAKVFSLGADILVAGNAVFSKADRQDAIRQLTRCD